MCSFCDVSCLREKKNKINKIKIQKKTKTHKNTKTNVHTNILGVSGLMSFCSFMVSYCISKKKLKQKQRESSLSKYQSMINTTQQSADYMTV